MRLAAHFCPCCSRGMPTNLPKTSVPNSCCRASPTPKLGQPSTTSVCSFAQAPPCNYNCSSLINRHLLSGLNESLHRGELCCDFGFACGEAVAARALRPWTTPWALVSPPHGSAPVTQSWSATQQLVSMALGLGISGISVTSSCCVVPRGTYVLLLGKLYPCGQRLGCRMGLGRSEPKSKQQPQHRSYSASNGFRQGPSNHWA